eukprot:TRINITY_DN3175_c0_g1_i1.p1 TRINITY_DN3175_c0_g1~~TRINITY_DN3175_c0_g1_i1.p1  ORF type:complete len:298 (-),score=76.18 TRINITY_DN3175_c0_g1_i1:1616-2446(-)
MSVSFKELGGRQGESSAASPPRTGPPPLRRLQSSGGSNVKDKLSVLLKEVEGFSLEEAPLRGRSPLRRLQGSGGSNVKAQLNLLRKEEEGEEEEEEEEARGFQGKGSPTGSFAWRNLPSPGPHGGSRTGNGDGQGEEYPAVLRRESSTGSVVEYNVPDDDLPETDVEETDMEETDITDVEETDIEETDVEGEGDEGPPDSRNFGSQQGAPNWLFGATESSLDRLLHEAYPQEEQQKQKSEQGSAERQGPAAAKASEDDPWDPSRLTSSRRFYNEDR